MGKFSSEEIESQYNLIKMLLAEPEKYCDAINAIKKDIPTIADLMREQKISSNKADTVHYRRDLDSLG